MDSKAFAPHDHDVCVADALNSAARRCAEIGLRLTPVRRRVLELLLEQHRAMGAYELLDHLREEGLGSQPPVAYRALEFLVAHGFVHKIERISAFTACAHPGEGHSPAFLICRVCHRVAEARADGERTVLDEVAAESGFRIERAVVEAMGVCPACQSGAAA